MSAWAVGDLCEYDAYGFCDQEGNPAIAANGDGVVVVAWASTVDLSGVSSHTWRMLYVRSTDGGQSWSLPAYLDAFAGPPSIQDIAAPALVTDANGNFVAAWRAPSLSSPNSGFALIRSTDDGQTWTPVTAAAGFGGYTYHASRNEGTGTIVMTASNTVQRSIDGGASWQDFHAIDDQFSYDSLTIANDGASTWMVAYSPYPASSRISVSTDDGATWSAFSPAIAQGRDPGIATDGAGTWYTATIDSTYSTYNNLVYFARSTDAGASWSMPIALHVKTYEGFPPHIVAHGNGRLEMMLPAGVDGGPGKDLDLVSFTSYDDGETWSRVRALTGSARVSSANTPGDGSDGGASFATVGDSTVVVWRSYEALRFDLGEGLDLGYDPDILFAIGSERCGELPRNDCRALGPDGRTSLKVKHSPGGNDTLKWSWKHGSATTLAEFGDPTTDTDYTFCLYGTDAAPVHLVSEQHMDTGGLCRSQACWLSKSSGYAYGDSSGVNGAIRRVSLTPGEAGDTSISAQGSGPSLGFPVLPIFGLTQMQLQVVKESDGTCWESVLDQLDSNTDRSLSLEGH